jgi:hypothetical protein
VKKCRVLPRLPPRFSSVIWNISASGLAILIGATVDDFDLPDRIRSR